MCHLFALLLLVVYDTGSSSYYMLHGADGRALIILLIHLYFTWEFRLGMDVQCVL